MKIVSLFDESANMVRPWAEDGHQCYCYDIQNGFKMEWTKNGGSIQWIPADLFDPDTQQQILDLKPDILFAFPPCTDLAVSGARHFEKKRQADPQFQVKAMQLFLIGAQLAINLGIPYMIENPVSVASTMWRKPDHSFHPFQYGGYLRPETAVHPRYPDIIPAADAYTKKTCLWTGNGFKMPYALPVPHAGVNHGWLKLGGKSARTKKIRSETPRGFAIAVKEANS